MGRPSKLDRKRLENIAGAIRDGNYAIVAAQAAGVHPATFFAWMKRGAEEDIGIFREFHDTVKSAEAEAELSLVAIVRAAAPQNWQAAMTILERKHPDRWGRRLRSEAVDELPSANQFDLTKLSDEQLETLGELLRVAGPPQGGSGTNTDVAVNRTSRDILNRQRAGDAHVFGPRRAGQQATDNSCGSEVR